MKNYRDEALSYKSEEEFKKEMKRKWITAWIMVPLVEFLIGLIIWPLLILAALTVPFSIILILLFPWFYKIDKRGLAKFLRM